MRATIALVSLSFIALLAGCSPRPYSFDHQPISTQGWPADSAITLQIAPQDTISPSSIYFYVKHTTDYPNANLYLFVHLYAPDGSERYDTLNYPMAQPNGQWLGRGFANQHELLLPYIINARFTQNGTYRIVTKHGMRYERLQGIQTIGIQGYSHQNENH